MRILFFAAGLMMAHQVMGKTARDVLFVVHFGAAALPLMKACAAAVAMLAGLTVPRLFQRYGTARTVPVAFAGSGLLHIVEYMLRESSPKTASVMVYLHVVALSAILLSSFWLLLSERFDPAEARRWFGRFAAYGTAGGVCGGLLTTAWSSAGQPGLDLLLFMGLLHLACGLCMPGQSRQTSMEPDSGAIPFLSPRSALSSAPYLRMLAVLVFLGTAAAAVIDIAFVTSAAASIRSETELMRFMAIFQTITQVTCGLLQTVAVRQALQIYTIGKNIASLPAAILAGSVVSFASPGLAMLTLVRGSEYVIRGSFFRSGYEVFYAPIPPKEKRAAKNLIDVVCDRAGDAAGSGLMQTLAWADGSASAGLALLTAGALAAANLLLSLRLDKIYSQVVHRALKDRAETIDEHFSRYGDWSLDTVLLESLPRGLSDAMGGAARQGWVIPAPNLDETTRHLAALRSGDAACVRQTLVALNPPEPALIPAVVELLGWGEVWKEARAALLRTGRRHVGQFVDWLTDPETDVSIRRRLPSLLVGCGGERAALGLRAGLKDGRFEVRLQCARALDSLVAADPALCPPADEIRTAVAQELSVSPQVWHARTVVDDQAGESYLEAADKPADYRLEMIFSLFALTCPREPLKAAFRALHMNDKVMFALGLEYVDSILTPDLRERFRALVAMDRG